MTFKVREAGVIRWSSIEADDAEGAAEMYASECFDGESLDLEVEEDGENVRFFTVEAEMSFVAYEQR